jgi:hypothetical protein
LGQPKNNLGRSDLPTLTLTIETAHVADTEEGPVLTSRIRWLGESTRSVGDVIEEGATGSGFTSAISASGEWLKTFLESRGGSADSAEIRREGQIAGHSEASLKRARTGLKVRSDAHGFPRSTRWTLSENPTQSNSGDNLGESGLTELTDPTEPADGMPVGPVGAAGSVGAAPYEDAPNESVISLATRRDRTSAAKHPCSTCGHGMVEVAPGRYVCTYSPGHLAGARS